MTVILLILFVENICHTRGTDVLHASLHRVQRSELAIAGPLLFIIPPTHVCLLLEQLLEGLSSFITSISLTLRCVIYPRMVKNKASAWSTLFLLVTFEVPITSLRKPAS